MRFEGGWSRRLGSEDLLSRALRQTWILPSTARKSQGPPSLRYLSLLTLPSARYDIAKRSTKLPCLREWLPAVRIMVTFGEWSNGLCPPGLEMEVGNEKSHNLKHTMCLLSCMRNSTTFTTLAVTGTPTSLTHSAGPSSVSFDVHHRSLVHFPRPDDIVQTR